MRSPFAVAPRPPFEVTVGYYLRDLLDDLFMFQLFSGSNSELT